MYVYLISFFITLVIFRFFIPINFIYALHILLLTLLADLVMTTLGSTGLLLQHESIE